MMRLNQRTRREKRPRIEVDQREVEEGVVDREAGVVVEVAVDEEGDSRWLNTRSWSDEAWSLGEKSRATRLERGIREGALWAACDLACGFTNWRLRVRKQAIDISRNESPKAVRESSYRIRNLLLYCRRR